jgi:hypothetical protein
MKKRRPNIPQWDGYDSLRHFMKEGEAPHF